MSSAVISTSAAQGRFFIFDDELAPEVSPNSRAALDRTAGGGCPCIIQTLQSKISHQKSAIPVTPASQLAIRPAPEMISSGITALDILTGGLPRGCLTEICGSASSGRTSVLLAALAATTRRGECCALIDASDALDPHSVAAARVDLDHLLWVRCGESLRRGGRLRPPRNSERSEEAREISPPRHPSASLRAGYDTEKSFFEKNPKSPRSKGSEPGCPTLVSRFVRKRVGNDSQSILNSDKSESRTSEHRLEQVLRATDLLLESGGFGLIALDLADVPPESARRIPLTTWFRFRRAIEHTPTILLVIEPQPIAGSCSSLLLQLGVPGTQYPVSSPKPSHSHLLTGLEITVELIRSRLDRKPTRSAAFETRTDWAAG